MVWSLVSWIQRGKRHCATWACSGNWLHSKNTTYWPSIHSSSEDFTFSETHWTKAEVRHCSNVMLLSLWHTCTKKRGLFLSSYHLKWDEQRENQFKNCKYQLKASFYDLDVFNMKARMENRNQNWDEFIHFNRGPVQSFNWSKQKGIYFLIGKRNEKMGGILQLWLIFVLFAFYLTMT